MIKEEKGINKALLFIVGLVVIASVPIYMGSQLVERHVQNRIVSDVVSIVGHTFENIVEYVKDSVGEQDIVIAMFHDEKLRERIEDKLSLLVTPEIKYVYIVYKDEEGKFRFLVDGSKEDKGELGEKLDVLNISKWSEALKEGKDTVIVQENLYTIGATYIKPILQDGSPKALLVADFSIQKIREIKGVLDIIRLAVSSTVLLSLFLLGMVIYQRLKRRSVERALYIDKLTGLYTKTYMESVSIDFADYYIALLDIDNFRKVNATYGEESGDFVLGELARLLKEKLKDFLLVRYAGEEFLILIPTERFPGKTELIKFFEELREEVSRRTFLWNSDEIKISVSIGINMSAGKHRSFEEAIKGADRALYRAKRLGKDRVEAYDESIEELKHSLSLSDIRDAIEDGRVICHYQPVVELNTGEISHYEALARLVSPKGEIIPPALFLDDIKDTFIYTRFVKDIIRINCEFLKKHEDLEVSINLVPTDVTDEAILSELKSIDKDLRKRMLLEITEVEGIPSFDRMKKSISKLRKLGFRICIDDFGAGYSNLINITQMKIDYLKIDGSIIKDIVKNRVSETLTRTITAFCKEVGIKVIAEYVENEAVLKKLKEMGVGFGQGFHLGKPKAL